MYTGLGVGRWLRRGAMAASKKRIERVLVMLDDDELHTLDTWRFKYRMPSRSAAIRELLRRGMVDLETDDAVQGRKSESFGMINEQASAD
jgi:metal-responsive CopG/Arc/MetJ family transcriptional regulator